MSAARRGTPLTKGLTLPREPPRCPCTGVDTFGKRQSFVWGGGIGEAGKSRGTRRSGNVASHWYFAKAAGRLVAVRQSGSAGRIKLVPHGEKF